MAAPKGNQFWKLRSKHGRDKLFESPELLWESACEYFEWCDENPLYEEVIEKVKVNGIGDVLKREQLPKMRPYTMQGLCLYLDCNTVYFNHFEESLKSKDNKEDKGFSKVITRIRETIYQQKFEGASVGFFNANIIARDLGLADKKEIDADVKQEIKSDIDYSKLSDETLKELLNNSQNKG
ncbi:DNA packaging protein [Empedobacter falsenii]|uniref:DNA-packaging protein n=1 Tax=Empedobacter falsenii TaxID=343874 RepID=UPI0025755666|nr:DNA-packaging protein [Empedobacter falsenii]MDM1548599.1 DNA packaging protein [Empedobacter falsenii]